MTHPQLQHEILSRRKEIAAALHDVSDPEIPGISIVDLGMVIDIREESGTWQVDLAPTYSGCPAIDVIPFLVKAKLDEVRLPGVGVSMIISPPWSTDWISETGRTKLHDYGIAPPNRKGNDMEGAPKQCPQCQSTHLMLISPYSSTPCKAAYRCLDCLEPFEYFKCY
ncbi:MAG: phenylacetate-CoA oxygenase subunit PaaJ [Bacteroidota bacterium]|nr:phenylacetate-CoA oxygenase subunit PaaJ [Bacteroidota bacterium]